MACDPEQTEVKQQFFIHKLKGVIFYVFDIMYIQSKLTSDFKIKLTL